MATVYRLLRRSAGRLRRRIRRARAGTPRPPALVSVVVPVYQVQDYVEECLVSILGQTYAHLEIIVVDDGSTDASMEVVRRVCAGDQRVRLLSQANAGLGAARNTGVRAARGEYLRFVDSDDVLPPDSVEVLLKSLRASGSDFVVGNLCRLEHGRAWTPNWAKEVHRADLTGIVLDDLPEVLKDPFAHNKLFSTAFFRRVVGTFPEGVRYEDQEPSARAYTEGRFDVLRTIVYHWRIREDGTSITQQKSNPADLRDRLQVKERVGSIMSTGASDPVFRSWAAKAVGFDLRSYYEQVPRTGPEFWEQLREGVFRVARFLDEDTWQQVPMIDRLLALATVNSTREDVITLITRRDEFGWQLPGVVEDGVGRLDHRYLDGLDLRLPEPYLRLAPADLALNGVVEALRFDGGDLVVDGYAHLTSIDVDTHEQRLELELVGEESGERRLLAVTRRPSVAAERESRDAWNSFAHAGFTTTVPVSTLPRPEAQVWRLVARIEVNGLVVEQPVVRLDRRRVARLPLGPLVDDDGRWTLAPDPVAGLGLRYVRLDPVRLVEAQLSGDDLRLVLTSPDPEVTVVARADGHDSLRFRPVRVDDDRVEVRMTLPADLGAVVDWQVRTKSATGRHRLFWRSSADDLEASDETGTTRLRCSREGSLSLRRSLWTAVVDHVGLESRGEDEVLLLEGRLSDPADARWTAELVEAADATEAVELAPDDDGVFRAAVALRTTRGRPMYDGALEVRLTRDDGVQRELRSLEASHALTATFPYETATARRGLTVDRASTGLLRLRLRRPYADDERGRLMQRRLWDLAAQPADALEPHTVVFEAFSGTRIADSPLAVFRELRERHPDWTYCWSVAELTTPVPEGSVALLRHSRRWTEVVRSAGYLVNNANFPHHFRKHPGQHYLQTWHGTPLKKIGRDMPLTHLSLSYRGLMVREAAAWDELLAQSPWAGEVLAHALGYTGSVLDQGYPRDDVLTDSETRRKEVRHELGLEDGSHVVLYAPTWRDDARTANGAYALVSHLDFAAARDVLGDVTFLLRGHSNTAAAGVDASAAVLDVTAYPDINDLMLAADALVTDYSSVMFDFCVTGKPLYFLVPDLDRYGSQTRGFYFDLLDAAPGPVCRDQAALIDALADRASYPERWGERYAAFVRRFAPHDDGRATQRVVDAVWGAQGRG